MSCAPHPTSLNTPPTPFSRALLPHNKRYISKHISSVLLNNRSVLNVAGCHHLSTSVFGRPPQHQSTFHQVIDSHQGHRQLTSFTLIAIVKERGPISATVNVEPRNHISRIAIKWKTRVDNTITQSIVNISFMKTGNRRDNQLPLSALLSSREPISEDVVSSLKLSEASSTAWCSTYERERHIA